MSELGLLLGTAAVLGVVHTLLGPDHYVPFVAMARAGGWSRAKTLGVTLGCGVGHVLGSVVLGTVGIGLGVAVGRLEAIETARGELAAWLLMGFGLTYAVWGLWRALRHQPHTHLHVHAPADGQGGVLIVHAHPHTHTGPHAHPHGNPKQLTPWVLFTIFVFGPCEPLIPLLMVPAAQSSWAGVAVVTTVFGVATLGTMAAVVLVAQAGVARVRFGLLERYMHALAGATIALCGVALRFLGL